MTFWSSISKFFFKHTIFFQTLCYAGFVFSWLRYLEAAHLNISSLSLYHLETNDRSILYFAVIMSCLILIIMNNTAFQIAGCCSVLFWPPLPVPLEFFSRVLSRNSVVILDTKLTISFSTLLTISLVRSRFSLRRTVVDVFFVSLKIKKIK